MPSAATASLGGSATSPSSGAAGHDWQMLLHGILLALLAFRGTLPAEERGALVQVLVSAHARLAPIVAAAGAPRGGSAASDAAAAWRASEGEPLSAAVERLRSLLLRSTDSALLGGLERYVWPCLGQLGAAAKRIATAAAGDAGGAGAGGTATSSQPPLPCCHGLRGRAWVLLGLLRWELLLPAHPVDPTCKHAVKGEALHAQLRSGRAELRAVQLGQDVWNALRARRICTRTRELIEAQHAARRAAERTCARPPPPAPQFAQLHREAMQWHRSLGAPATVLQLSADLHRGGVGGALAREEGWQQSSGRFVERLATSFGGFEDVEGPLRLSVYEVKHGLRTQAQACTRTALAAAEGLASVAPEAAAAHGLMRSLLAFPQRPAVGGRGGGGAATAAANASPASAAGALPLGLLPLLQPLPIPGPASSEGDAPSSVLSSVASGGEGGGGEGELRAAVRAQRWRVSQQTGLLVLALRRLYVMVLLSGQPRRVHLDALNRIMAAFARTQVEVEAAEAKRQQEEAALYKTKTREYGSNIDEQAREYDALRALFPDYADEFADLEERAKEAGLNVVMPSVGGDDEADDADDAMDGGGSDNGEGAAEGAGGEPGGDRGGAGAGGGEGGSTQPLQVDPELILQLVTYHQRVFGDGGGAGFVGLSRSSGEVARASNGATVSSSSSASRGTLAAEKPEG